MVHILSWGFFIYSLVLLVIGVGAGVLYRGRKIKVIIAILKDAKLSEGEKMKKILEILVGL